SLISFAIWASGTFAHLSASPWIRSMYCMARPPPPSGGSHVRGVLVVVSDPALHAIPLLLPTEGGQVEEVVHVEAGVEPALVDGVAVEDGFAFAEKDAEPRQLALGVPELPGAHEVLGIGVVVLDAPVVLVERGLEVVVEVAVGRRHPVEAPPHPPPE